MSAPTLPKTPLSILEIVHSALLEGDFDGLYNTDNDCACLTGNLSPCDSMTENCTAGFLLPCQCGEECGYHIGQTPSEGFKP